VGGARQWINGVEYAPTLSDTGTSSIPTTSTNAAIGNWNHTTNRMFSGVIYTVALWARALSAAEAWSLYDPRTRWDLYRVPTRRLYVDIGSAAPAGGKPWIYYANQMSA
jgi:hypothetical protein